MNKVGVRIEPCDPPRKIENHLDFSPLISTYALRLDTHDSIQFKHDLDIPSFLNFPRHPSIHS